MKFKFSIPMLLAFSLGFIGGSTMKYLYEISNFKQYQWRSTPAIINCYGQDFLKQHMLRGIDYWAIRGHSIDYYNHNPSKEKCAQEYLAGFIILRKVDKNKKVDDELLAVTSRRTVGFAMESAVIWFKPGTQNLDLIIEHELGHAFGYGHVEEVGHLMYPTYDMMGKKFWIP